MGEKGKQVVLIHGACHGAWCWYKVNPLLRQAGYHVTALDMAGAGVHPMQMDEVQQITLQDYSQPLIQLLNSIPDDDDQKVILVGHSLGGLNLALAMEMFPHKIEAVIFLTAFVPDTHHAPSFVVEQLIARMPEGGWLDTEFKRASPEQVHTTMLFGPKFLSLLYHLSPLEDLELGMLLKRPSSFFLHDLQKAKNFSQEKRRKIRQVYVVCEQDKVILRDFQLWMAENGGVREVKELQGADHMPMFSMPQQLSDCLVDIFRT